VNPKPASSHETHIQRIRAHEGKGHVPCVDPRWGEIITATDYLLKDGGGHNLNGKRMNLLNLFNRSVWAAVGRDGR
jgi:hypothetical protein